MPAPNGEVLVVAEWVKKAEGDLMTAAHTLKLGAICPTDTVCFHAQQCVEKYLKGLLVSMRKPIPKTHAIEKLISLLPSSARPALTATEQQALTDYAVAPRYPGWEEVSLTQARKAVALARRVRKHVRSILPKAALRLRRR